MNEKLILEALKTLELAKGNWHKRKKIVEYKIDTEWYELCYDQPIRLLFEHEIRITNRV